MQVFNRHVSGRGLTVFGFETVLITAAVLLAAQLHGSLDSAMGSLWRVVLVTALCELCFYYNDLYDLTVVHSKTELAVRILQGAGAVAVILGGVSLFVPGVLIGSGTFLTALGLLLVAVPAWRLAFDGVTRDPHMEERVLILGTSAAARSVADLIGAQHDYPFRVVGVMDDPDAPDQGGPGIGSHALSDLIRQRRVDRVVVSLSDRRGRMPIRELLQAKMSGVRVEDAATMYERLTGKILIDEIKPSWLIFSDGFRASRLTRAMKRMADLLLAVAGLLLAWPLMLLTALAVYLESPGPVLYRQERVGENGRIFTLCKFRSMRLDAERGTPIWAKEKDDRVTRIGRFIRLTRLDELPQLWNVLLGEMSLVGPRPCLPSQTALIEARNKRGVLEIPPGVTGLAQVNGIDMSAPEVLASMDAEYLRIRSFTVDLRLILATILGRGIGIDHVSGR